MLGPPTLDPSMSRIVTVSTVLTGPVVMSNVTSANRDGPTTQVTSGVTG